MNELDKELQLLKEKLSRKQKAEAMLRSLRAEIAELERERIELKALASKEQDDVERLEKPSLTSLLYSLINKKSEKLDKEKAEAYAAAVKLQSKEMQLENAEQHARSLEAELKTLSDVESRYRETFAKKTEALKSASPELASVIADIEERLAATSALQREIDEALMVGTRALSLFPQIEYELANARDYAKFDVFVGGLFTDLAKHSHLDNCQNLVYELQIILNDYRTELADIQVFADVNVQIDGFMRFADFFFDGLFADLAVLDRIKQSQSQLQDVRYKIESMQNRLRNMKDGLQLEAEQLKARLEELVLKA